MSGGQASGSRDGSLAVSGRDRLPRPRRRAVGVLGFDRGEWPGPRSSRMRSRAWRVTRASTGASSPASLTTRIYCRPTCPVKPAKSRNVVFFPTAAAAERAGFRPCLALPAGVRPGTPAWHGAGASVSRALRLIKRGFLDDGGTVEELALTLGMTARHLRRLFLCHAGASPVAVATTTRVQRAKSLIEETAMPHGRGGLRRRILQHPALQRRASAPCIGGHLPPFAGRDRGAGRAAWDRFPPATAIHGEEVSTAKCPQTPPVDCHPDHGRTACDVQRPGQWAVRAD